MGDYPVGEFGAVYRVEQDGPDQEENGESEELGLFVVDDAS